MYICNTLFLLILHRVLLGVGDLQELPSCPALQVSASLTQAVDHYPFHTPSSTNYMYDCTFSRLKQLW